MLGQIDAFVTAVQKISRIILKKKRFQLTDVLCCFPGFAVLYLELDRTDQLTCFMPFFK